MTIEKIPPTPQPPPFGKVVITIESQDELDKFRAAIETANEMTLPHAFWGYFVSKLRAQLRSL